jgi:nucleotide-binding universal stress UspA family protein
MFPKKILVATDASGEAYPAVEAAVELANGTGSELHVVFVVSTAPELPYPKFIARERNEAYLEQKRLGGLRLLGHQVRRVEELGGKVTQSHYREGKPEREVIRLGREIGAGLIVTGGQKRPWFVRLFGPSFSTRLFRKADRPVLIVDKYTLQNLVVPK